MPPASGHHGAGDDVDDDQGQGHVGVVAERDDPGQERVAHALHPGQRIEVSAEGVAGQVERIEGQPVIELPVVAVAADDAARWRWPPCDGCSSSRPGRSSRGGAGRHSRQRATTKAVAATAATNMAGPRRVESAHGLHGPKPCAGVLVEGGHGAERGVGWRGPGSRIGKSGVQAGGHHARSVQHRRRRARRPALSAVTSSSRARVAMASPTA